MNVEHPTSNNVFCQLKKAVKSKTILRDLSAFDYAIWRIKNTICRYQHLCHMSYVVVNLSICHMAQLKEDSVARLF